jgi:acetyl-CoA carboxylase alpha subunit
VGNALKVSLSRHLRELTHLSLDELLEQRYQKFRRMGLLA